MYSPVVTILTPTLIQSTAATINASISNDKAISFGAAVGSSSRLTVPNAAAFKNISKLTLEATVNLTAYPASAISDIIDYSSASSKGFRFRISTTGKVSVLIGNGTTGVNFASVSSVPLNTPTHLAVTWDGSFVRIFIGGVLDASIAGLVGGNTNDPAQSLFIGNNSGFVNALIGTIDEVRISNIVRYQSTVSPTTFIPQPLVNDANTMELWHFNEGTGTTATGENGNVGTFGGTPTPTWVTGFTDPITSRGVQFGTTPNPDRSVDEVGSFSVGAFSEAIANLFTNQVYYARAYAGNSSGIGYSAWTSFTTLQDTYSILINGIERSQDITVNTVIVEDNINDKTTNCQFEIIDRRNLGLPQTDQEIIITLATGTRLFAGRVLKVNQKIVLGTFVAADINCIDYTRDLDRNLVNTTYLGDTDQFVITDIIENDCQGSGVTANNVLLGVNIDQIAFNYVQPSAAFRKICDVTGRNWFIDYFKDIHYFPLTQNPAPFNITDSQRFDQGEGYFGLQLAADASQLKNRVYVRGGTKLSDPTSYQTSGDGVKTQFVLPDKPHDVTLFVNSVQKSVGIKDIDTSGFDFYLNYDEKYVEQDASEIVLGTGDTLAVNYTYDIPILVAIENTASIMANGVEEFLIVDQTITTTQAARDRATAELTDYGNNIVEGQFSTYTPGFRSGQFVNVNSTVLNISNQNYIIQRVISTSIGGGKFFYTIYLASSKTMGIIRFLLEMLENNKNLAQVSSNEVLDNLITLNDSLDPNSLTDLLTIDSAGPYSTWCTDSLTASVGRARWGVFQWG